MAKVSIKGVTKINSTLRKEIIKSLRDKELREDLGEKVAKAIKDENQGLPADSTKKWRERYDRLNKTDPEYDRQQIKMVFTGELLDDLAKNVRAKTTSTKVEFTIENSDKRHKKYQGVTKKIGSRSPYSKIAQGLRKLGYNYPNISEETEETLIQKIKSVLIEKLKRTFKVK